MSWLARLKAGKTPEKDAAKTTETFFVVSVAPTLVPLQKKEGPATAANDPAHAPTTVQAFSTESVIKLIDIGTVRPPRLSPLLLAASLASDASISAAGTVPGNDPDADCWPRSAAITGTEIDLFTARLHRFTAEKYLTCTDGEALADRLLVRDREADDRQSCLECRHLAGYGQTSWRCGNWQAAEIAIRPRETQLPVDLVLQLQRCGGFSGAMPNAKGNANRNSITNTLL